MGLHWDTDGVKRTDREHAVGACGDVTIVDDDGEEYGDVVDASLERH